MTKREMKKLASLFASMGGRAKSPAKAAAARRNGAKGGRPRKVKPSTKTAKAK